MFPSRQRVIAYCTAAVVAVACTQERNSATAIDYIGGWVPSTSKTQCVNVCGASKSAPTCSDPMDRACTVKKQTPGDFDYLTLEQLFVPQFCRDLLEGVDSTVSHRNVIPYPKGITCTTEIARNELTIHGLWPNYYDGYPACCNVSATIPNKPYNAATFAANKPKLLKTMATKWIDPTQNNAYDTLCEIYNHEFQKHGLCFAAYGQDYEKAALNYFQATLAIAAILDAATAQINSWAKLRVPLTTVASIQALYTHRIQVLCSASGTASNQLGAIRTCFEKPIAPTSTARFLQKDCAAAVAAGAFVPCDPDFPVTLLGYTPPAQIA